MKKKISFLVILTVVLLATQVSADTISQIGKKVAGESSVYLNGNKIQSAIIVDDSSYAPIRAIAEALGVEVAFEKLSEGNVIKMSTPELTREETNALIWKKADLEAKVKGANTEIERATNAIAYNNEQLEKEKNEEFIKFLQGEVVKEQQKIIQAQEDIITYTNELLELESAQ